MSREWFSREDKLMEALLKQALAQHFRGFLDPCDAGSLYDCTILMPQTFEIKCDKKACVTGNLYFETRNTRQQAPSGLTSTQATYWAHYVPAPHNRIMVYDPRLMLAFLQEQLTARRPGFVQTLPHGGDNNSQGIIAPITAIVAQAFVTSMAFTLELPQELRGAEGCVWRCQACGRLVAIEVLYLGLCLSCRAGTPDAIQKGA